MLVLTRKEGEEIIIGRDIKVVVLKISEGRVLLGIAAPEDVPIKRRELLARDRRQPTPPLVSSQVWKQHLPNPSRPGTVPWNPGQQETLRPAQ